MKIPNTVMISILYVLLTIHMCDDGAHSHDTHLSDADVKKPVVWVAPDTFKDMSGKCYTVYKDSKNILVDPITLHIKEVPCG